MAERKKSVVVATEAKDVSGKGFFIGNSSSCPRGFTLKKGIVILKPYEIREVPANAADEVRALLKTDGMQAMVDAGLLQISDKPIVSLNEHPTPKAPEELAPQKRVESTGAMATASASIDGKTKGTMRLEGKVSL